MPVYCLYWDESDEQDDSYEKVRRAVYATLAEAKAQATHDIACLRCRVYDGNRATLKTTGLDPRDPDGVKPCPDCDGTGVSASKRILCIEKVARIEKENMNRGEIVWEPEDAQASGS